MAQQEPEGLPFLWVPVALPVLVVFPFGACRQAVPEVLVLVLPVLFPAFLVFPLVPDLV